MTDFDMSVYMHSNALTPNLQCLAESYTKTPDEADRELVLELEHSIALRIASPQTDEVLGERRMLEAIHAKDVELLKELVLLDQNQELNVNPNAVLFTDLTGRLGGGPQQQQSYFCSPAHYCVRTRDRPIPLLEALLAGGGSPAVGGEQHRVNLNARDSEGNAPLHFASAFGRADVVEWLLRHGADQTVQNVMGDTPLHVAVKTRQPDSARALFSDARGEEAAHIFNNDRQNAGAFGLSALLAQRSTSSIAELQYGHSMFLKQGTYWMGENVPVGADVADAALRAGAGAGADCELELVLTWENTNDLDLHLQCPNGEHIFYKHKHALCGGELSSGREVTLAIDEKGNPLLDSVGNQQVTNPLGDSIERIHWPRGREPPRGVYEVAVHQFALHNLKIGQSQKQTHLTQYYLVIRVRGKLVWEFRGEMRVTKEKQILRVFEWPWNENLEGNRPIQMHSFLSFTGRGPGFDVPPIHNEFFIRGMLEPRPSMSAVRGRSRPVTVGAHKGKRHDCSVM